MHSCYTMDLYLCSPENLQRLMQIPADRNHLRFACEGAGGGGGGLTLEWSRLPQLTA